jgi:uncharacterized protein (TIGR03067 family)
MKAFIIAIRLLGLSIMVPALAGPPATTLESRDRKNIQGTWKLVALEADGQPAPPEIVAALKLVFKGNTLTFTRGEPSYTYYTFTLVPTNQPCGFTMIHADGSEKGKIQNGIYSLSGDRLKICLASGNRSPRDFKTTAGSGLGLYALEREK